MKKSFITIFLFIGTFTIRAQQRPQYTQYILNNYIVNPALTGIENYTDIKLSARHQWNGVEGSPKTYYLTVHGPIGKKDYKSTATSFEVQGSSLRGEDYANTQTSKPHHGIGLTINNDATGSFNRFSIAATYAYHVGLNQRTSISAGFSAGISALYFNRSKAVFENPGDPVIVPDADQSSLKPDLAAGVWLYSEKHFIGVSVQQLIPVKVNFANKVSGYKQVPHFFATAGYRVTLNDELYLIPSVMLKYVTGTPTAPQADVNIKMQYNDMLWVGASYRLQDGYAGMAGFNINNAFNIGYAYDYAVTALNTVSSGTHEIVIGFMIGNKYSDKCPQNIW